MWVINGDQGPVVAGVSRPTAAHVTRHRDANVRIPGLTQEFVHCLICLSSSFLSNIVEYGEYLKLWRILVSQTRHIEKEEECYISECQDLTFLYSHFYRLYINVWISCVDFHYHLASEKHIFLIDENVARAWGLCSHKLGVWMNSIQLVMLIRWVCAGEDKIYASFGRLEF